MLIDGRALPDRAQLTTDLTIVGSGPAGLSMADRLRSSGLSICLLESGGYRPELATQQLYRGAVVGRPYFALDGCRFRMFGGSSNRWGGWCRPLDPADFASPAGSAWPGWPIDDADLLPYGADVAALLELRDDEFDAAASSSQPRSGRLAFTDEDFEHTLVRFSPQTNFARRYGQRVLDDPAITTVFHANVTELILEPGTSRLGAVRVQTLTGTAFTVHSRAIVLAAGGIENPRLMLASNRSRGAGIGNEHDLVGRCFMEHIHAPAGHVQLTGHVEPPAFYRRTTADGEAVRNLIAPTGQARRRHGLLACSFMVEPAVHNAYSTPYLGWPSRVTFPAATAYLKLKRHSPHVAEKLRRQTERLWYAGQRSRTGRAEQRARALAASRLGSDPQHLLALYARAEQCPSAASRVSLGSRRDALGLPRARLDWRLAEADTDSVSQWLARLDAGLRRSGQGRVVPPPEGWEARIIGGPHHMGTTRMSADPRSGVVDATCRVHSVDNLYVAGSSVFATGGWANPIFSLVALSLRLADHLRTVLGAGRPPALDAAAQGRVPAP